MRLEHLKTIAAKRQTVFKNAAGEVHDRSQFLGGSEVYGCPRKNWFVKNGAETDPGYVEKWGFFQRGHLIEDWVVDLIRETYPTAEYLYTGSDQKTLIHRNIAVTPDGLIVRRKRGDLVVEIKSLDPRSDLDKPKPAHVFQAQLQIEMFHACTVHDPDQVVLVYVNASDFSDLRLHWVERNPDALSIALKRADDVFSASSPTDLMARGVITGDCKYCGYTQACGAAVVRDFPQDKADHCPPEVEADIEELVARRQALSDDLSAIKEEKGEVEESIKHLLRQHNLKAVAADRFSIGYTLVSGRKTLDTHAVEAAGIDLSPFYKEGHASERLTIKLK